MDRTMLFALGILLIALAGLFFAYLNQPMGTGLFGLSAGQETEKPAEAREDEISTSLSFTVLKPTRLEASLSGEEIRECPEETEVEITVKNSGKSPAEKVFLEFGPGIKVTGCQNCLLNRLNPGQEARARARICLASKETQFLSIGSANSNQIEIGLK